MNLCQKWSRDMFCGLHHLHEHSILHRDLKPANLLLQIEEGTCSVTCKLADFGASRAASTSNAYTPCVCTPLYAAPETFMVPDSVETAAYGPPADLWSAGIICRELLTGTQTIKVNGNNQVALAEAICQKIGPPGPSVTASWDQAVAQAVHSRWAAAVAKAKTAKAKAQAKVSASKAKSHYEELHCHFSLFGPGTRSSPAEAKELVVNLVMWDPARRWTAERALHSSWLSALRSSSDAGQGGRATAAPAQVTETQVQGSAPALQPQVPSCEAGRAPATPAQVQGSAPASPPHVPSFDAQAAPGPAPQVLAPAPQPQPQAPSYEAGQDQATAEAVPQTPAALPKPPPPTVPGSGGATAPEDAQAASDKCACSGHCRQPGHRYRGCNAVVAGVMGTRYCTDCMCAARGCPKPRWDGSTCHKHSRWLANMSSGLRAAWHFQTWLGDLLPCDLAAYDRVWDSLRGDPVLETIAALIKEPTPVLEFSSMVRGLRFDYNHLDLGQHVLIPLLRYMDGRLEKEEHQSLNGQGPAT